MLMIGKLTGAAALSLVLWLSVDWPAAFAVLAGADGGALAAALAASMATILLSARKWQLLLERARIRLAYAAAAQLYWIGSFFSNFLPTGVGGDAVRLMLTPAPDGRGPVAASILVERLSGLFVMLVLSACALVVLPLDLGLGLPRLVLVAGVLGLATVMLAILYLPGFFLGCLFMVEQGLPRFARRPLAFARRLAAGMFGRGCDARAVTVAILYSFPFYGAMMVAQYWMLRSVGAEVGLLAVDPGRALGVAGGADADHDQRPLPGRGRIRPDLCQHRGPAGGRPGRRDRSAAGRPRSIPGSAASCGWPGRSGSADRGGLGRAGRAVH